MNVDEVSEYYNQDYRTCAIEGMVCWYVGIESQFEAA